MFARTPVVTIRSGIAALRLKLWDEEGGSLVGFPARRALALGPAAAAKNIRASGNAPATVRGPRPS